VQRPARGRHDDLHLPRPRRGARDGRAARSRDGRDPRPGPRAVRRQGRLDAPGRRLGRRARLLRRGRRPPAVRLRHRACGSDARHGLGLAVLLRRRVDEHRRLPRGDEPGGGVEARDRVRVREQPLRRVLADRDDDARGTARRPGRGLLDAGSAGRRKRRGGGPRRRRRSVRAGPQRPGPDLPRGAHLPAYGPLAQRSRGVPPGRRARALARARSDHAPRAAARGRGRSAGRPRRCPRRGPACGRGGHGPRAGLARPG